MRKGAEKGEGAMGVGAMGTSENADSTGEKDKWNESRKRREDESVRITMVGG